MFNRKMYILFIILVVVFAIVFLKDGCQKMRYPIGRDTVKSFGDGTYQILRQSSDKRNELVSLHDLQKIIYDVKTFKQINTIVLVIGDNKYVILKYEEGIVEIYDNLQDIPDHYKKQFEKLER